MVAKLTGKVVEIDVEGNLTTDVSAKDLAGAPHDSSLRIVVDEHETFGLYPLEHNQPAMTLDRWNVEHRLRPVAAASGVRGQLE